MLFVINIIIASFHTLLKLLITLRCLISIFDDTPIAAHAFGIYWRYFRCFLIRLSLRATDDYYFFTSLYYFYFTFLLQDDIITPRPSFLAFRRRVISSLHTAAWAEYARIYDIITETEVTLWLHFALIFAY